MALTVKPFAEKHAIRNVVFAFEFATPLSQGVLRNIQASDVHRELMQKLPQFSEQTAVMLNIGAGNAIPQFGGVQPELNGLSYAFIMPNGEPAWAVNIQSSVLVITCGDYARWIGTWNEVRNYLKILLPHILLQTRINVVGLQYLDEFSISAGEEEFPLRSLFQEGSIFIPQNLLDMPGACHSHHGYFDYPSDPFKYKRLTNVNVGVVETGVGFTVQIHSVHKCLLNDPLEGDVASLIDDGKSIDRLLHSLHQDNKRIVGSLLVEKVKESISFDSRK